MHVGYQILANISDTMSDRASTEKNTFNSLLDHFRNDILLDVIDNWNDKNRIMKLVHDNSQLKKK